MKAPLLCLLVAGLFPVAASSSAVPARAASPETLSSEQPQEAPTPDAEIGRGRATWYGAKFHGRRTSSGERFDMNELTAAHEFLPFGTRVRVRNVANGREVVVRINDRAPHLRDRVIDLSKAAAAALGFVKAGAASVVLFED